MKENSEGKFLNKKVVMTALKGAFLKLDPRYMINNTVMFIVEIGCFISLLFTIAPSSLINIGEGRVFNGIIFLILFITLLFANFAESIAEGKGKAQADSLKQSKKDAKANLLNAKGEITVIDASELKQYDIVICSAGDIIPGDGEVIEGIASVDESAITGESAPVLKQAGSDFSSVTGGTRVVSDTLKIKILVNQGESFLDKMIGLVEGASRQKTPNEIALEVLLITLTAIFIIVTISLYFIGNYVNVKIGMASLIALLVCLIPTTIGGLLSSIGIAGMNRAVSFNVIAMSGKAVEACGDVSTIILDKTGTITYGNRLAADFVPVGDHTKEDVIKAAAMSSLMDETPEGTSVVVLAEKLGFKEEATKYIDAEIIEFSAENRMSGMILNDGTAYRKGAGDSIKELVESEKGSIPCNLEKEITDISLLGGTPLVVAVNNDIVGVIYLKDTVKEGLRERFERLRSMGIKTIMCTGDNPLTAKTIAKEAGVDAYIAEAKPEDKIEAIKEEQSQGKLVAMTGDGTNDAPALAQADVGIAMNSGTMAAKEAANMIDLDSNPTKIIEIVEIGKQLLITRGALTTFSIANDVAKYFAVLPAIFAASIPSMNTLNIMGLSSSNSAIVSALIFNAVIIPALIPIAMKGVKYRSASIDSILTRNLLVYGLGGCIVPFIAIKVIDMIITPLLSVLGIL
ncbi:potassium-transporting ATPase subunit KdpB [Clostridium cylindrosporum]|uniref:Potassium-transporting ATPase ATP-binding subunit n=1 Tax=Clostridium cylindrosporum DSM 605 TaxID=1121307 RepID=A0A0J8DF07_CLOCY|nr:potassium-transporting ATPase subunit KdpB [Clostridium cylindrosporum]KMT22844.1 potassium-transporting ATPase B chain KdpB [Clostridium cylindrosporum DSM 605]